MSGINTLRGLNNMSVDFRPTVELIKPKTNNTNQLQPGTDIAPQNVPQPQRAEAKSVVQQLDVLLLNAAGKSVSADIVKNVNTIGKSLIAKGVLTQKQLSKLESLAETAAAKLKALDKFSGRELAEALMEDKKTGETVWSKGFFFLNSTAKAVKSAIEAQQTLSMELGKFNERLAQAPKDLVDAKLQDQFTELQFQCDRRASEIDSIVFRMYDLTQQDAVKRGIQDPKITTLLDATFNELMPREAIMMHGTKEAFEKLDENITKQMRPLVEKLDAFTADGSKVLSHEDILSLKLDMTTMKNAIANVRENGIKITHPGTEDKPPQVVHTEVDKSLLDAMEKVLDDAAARIDDAKNASAMRARETFLKEVKASLCPEDAPGGDKVVQENTSNIPVIHEFKMARNEFIKILYDRAADRLTDKQFNSQITACIAKFMKPEFNYLESTLTTLGYAPSVARSVAKAVGGLTIIKGQFKELMKSTKQMMDDKGDLGITTSDVRRIMLGEVGLSSVVEAKARGFKPGDVKPAADESNVVSSKPLGSGNAGMTYLVKMKSGEEFVFKPELESRLGLSELSLGGTAYVSKQMTANLNLATQDTAETFGCKDVVVKYSVGSHNGQFGVFMEKAKGCEGSGFACMNGVGGDDGIAPQNLGDEIKDDEERRKIKGTVAQKLNKLMWLDLITGQGDRHWNNYFVHIHKDTHEVTVKGIDNDAAFSSRQVGLQKYALEKSRAERFDEELKDVCKKLFGKGWEREYERVSNDPSLVRNTDGTMTVNLADAKTPEIKMAAIPVLGLQSTALPEEIDEDFYNKLMEMDKDPSKKQDYLNSLAPRISKEALTATESRLNEAIEHAKKLKEAGKVYGANQWQDKTNLFMMTGVAPSVEIEKSDGTTITADPNLQHVRDFRTRDCPSLYKREKFDNMFITFSEI